MADQRRLYFTIGPVQAFVAQSRRTRDLWASSYLLSHLADVAMRAVEGAGGQIVLPARNKQPEALGPGEVQHGRWPNRFVAKVNDPQAAAEAAKTAFFEAWKKITNCIWRKYVQPVASSSKGVTEVPHRQEQRSARFNYEAEAIWNR